MDQFSQISYLMIEVNSACNLKCSFCNREELVEKGWRNNKLLSPDEFGIILEKFKDCKIDTVKLEGISEPMLHPKFDECAKVLKEKFPKAFIIIATNLQYNVERTPFLSTLSYVDMVYLSIDGVGKTYEEARTGSKYDKLLKALDFIKENVSIEERKKKLYINFTLTEFNYMTLPEVYELNEKYNFAGVRINLAQNWSEDQKNNRDFNKDVIRMATRYKKDLKGVPNWDYDKCFWPYEGLIVDVFGDVRQCIINTSQKPIGNIYKDNLRELFNNSYHYQKTRDSLRNCKSTLNCKNCDYKLLAPVLKEIMGEEMSGKVKSRAFVDVEKK